MTTILPRQRCPRCTSNVKQTPCRDLDARNALVSANLGLVPALVKRYFPAAHRRTEDAIQAGYLGLIRAAELFDESRGSKFSTYACWCIRREVQRFLYQDRLIAISEHMLRRHSEHDEQGMAAPVSISKFGEVLVDQCADDPTDVDSPSPGVLLRKLLRNCIYRNGESKIVAGKLAGKTLQQIGQELGISKERVRQKLGGLYKRLRKNARKRGLRMEEA